MQGGRLIDAVMRRPRAAFGAFLTLHFLVWTALPTLLFVNLPMDVIEGLVFGREMQIGYWKHPPLPWWLVELAHRIIGYDVAYYVLAQLAVTGAFIAVWMLGRRLVGEAGALVAVLVTDGIRFFSLGSIEFNHNTAQLPFWGLAGYAFHAGLRRGRMTDWVLLGVALGLALWAKYFVVVLALPLVLFLLLDREARKTLATAGPWVAAGVALLVAAPHLIWLFSGDLLPFTFINDSAPSPTQVFDRVRRPLSFILSEIGILAPAALIAIPLIWPKSQPSARSEEKADAYDCRIVAVLAFGPGLLLVASTLVTGRDFNASWAFPAWLFVGLWMVLHARRIIDKPVMTRIASHWAAVLAVLVTIFLIDLVVMPYAGQQKHRQFFPGERYAAEVAARYRAATGEPLLYVIGDTWIGGNAVVYARDPLRLLVDGNPAHAPWIDVADLRARGAAIVWLGDPASLPPDFSAFAADAEIGQPIVMPYSRGRATLTTGWAVLRPARAPASSGK